MALLIQEQQRLELEQTKIQRLEQNFPKVFEYLDTHIAKEEAKIDYDIIAQKLKSQDETSLKN